MPATQASVNSWRPTYYIMLDYMSLLRNTSSFIHSSGFICSPVTPFTYWLFHSAFYSHNIYYWSVSQLFIYLASNMSHLGLSNLKETLLIQDLKPALNEIVGSEKRFLN